MFSSKSILLPFKLLLIISVALAFTFVADVIYRKEYELSYKLPAALLPFPPIEQKYQLVKLGNSHAQDGINLKKYKLRSLNLSGVAQRFEFDLALLKQHAQQIEENAIIIINVSPLSFSHTAANSLKGFQSGYYGRVSPFYIPNLNWADYVESQFLPFTRVGYLWRQRYSEQIKERISKEEKWVEPSLTPEIAVAPEPDSRPRSVAIVEPEPVVVPSEAGDPDEHLFNVATINKELQNPSPVTEYSDNKGFIYTKWYHTNEFSPDYFDENRKDLERLISYSLRHNWRPVLVTVPVSKDLIDSLEDDYLEKYLYENLAKTDLSGQTYIDFSNETRITNNLSLYGNSDHLNKKGGIVFSYLLLKELIDRGFLNQEVDGYDYTPIADPLVK